MKEILRDSINNIHKVPIHSMNQFLDLWEVYTANKKEVITEADKTDRYLYFVTEGCQKAYFLKDGKEFIVAFSYPFAFTCVPESFLTQKPSKYYWQSITDSSFLRISYPLFFDFIRDNKDFETMLNKKLLGTINGLVLRYHRLLACSMEERFKDLMENSPQLLNMAPQKDLANYLKIDPTNFSKLINSVKL